MELIIASGNEHKLAEIKKIFGEGFELKSMAEVGITEDIPETAESLTGNALMKARYVYDRMEKACLSEDTGLEVWSLNMAPGVHSARYADDRKNPESNIIKLLDTLRDYEDRAARFRTVIALIIDEGIFFFEGEVKGHIAHQPGGRGGFGYDPVFIPDGFDKSFGELPEEIKLTISHRRRALDKCQAFLRSYLKCKSPLSAKSSGLGWRSHSL